MLASVGHFADKALSEVNRIMCAVGSHFIVLRYAPKSVVNYVKIKSDC